MPLRVISWMAVNALIKSPVTVSKAAAIVCLSRNDLPIEGRSDDRGSGWLPDVRLAVTLISARRLRAFKLEGIKCMQQLLRLSLQAFGGRCAFFDKSRVLLRR